LRFVFNEIFLNPISLAAASHQQMNPRTPLLPRLAISLLLGALILPACDWRGLRGNGVITTENRTVERFTDVEANGAYEIEWSSGTPALAITSDQNLLSHIKTRVSGEKLKIDSDEHLSPTKKIKVVLSSETLNGAQLNGAVRFHAAKLMGPNFYLETSGATKVTLDGQVNSLTASMTGASKLMADSLRTQTTELSVTGAAEAEVWASETLAVAISGAGKVTYAGNPKAVKKDVSGAGKIRPRA
jgi:putative autotransporter adhesin-like protein